MRKQHMSIRDESGVSKRQARDKKATPENDGLTPSGSAPIHHPPEIICNPQSDFGVGYVL